ncbi:hypothetical protein BJY01DRAFT_240716 [Aspergillus pseudoustus]|uniref:NAD(P)-binding protein n=1 Tax=Aspergillus pseudoustus TaxID=1810923 RepID=A0ABR4INF1_9EURO
MTLFPGVAVITGGGSGIGANIATEFAKEGCKRIAMCDRNGGGLKQTEAAIKRVANDVAVFTCIVDVTIEEQIETFIKSVAERFGGIHYAVNAAGISCPPIPSAELDTRIFDNVFQINCRGVWLSSKFELKQMITQDIQPTHDGRPGERGCVLNIASQLAFGASPGLGSYIAAKAAVVAMTKCDAMDYAAHQIRVNCLCPGSTDTPMSQPQTHEDKVQLERITAKTPMKRMGKPQEMADAAMFLCSSKASFVQGAALLVDGGFVIA